MTMNERRSSQAYSTDGLDEATLRDRLIDQAERLTGEAIGVAFPGRGAALWHEGRLSVLDPVGQPGRELGEAIDALLESEDLRSPTAVRDALLTMAGARSVVHRVAVGEPAEQREP
jgi:hypothetical protein